MVLQNDNSCLEKMKFVENRNRLIDFENKLMVARVEWGGWGRDSWGVCDGQVHTAMFKIDNQQRPTG